MELNGDEITGLLKNGNRGEEVKSLQTALGRQGYNVGGVDGIFGAKTLAAVKAFQKAHGLTVDGVVGPQTASALGLDWQGGSSSSDSNTSSSPSLSDSTIGSGAALTAPMTDWSKYALWGGVAVVGILIAKKKGWLKKVRR